MTFVLILFNSTHVFFKVVHILYQSQTTDVAIEPLFVKLTRRDSSCRELCFNKYTVMGDTNMSFTES